MKILHIITQFFGRQVKPAEPISEEEVRETIEQRLEALLNKMCPGKSSFRLHISQPAKLLVENEEFLMALLRHVRRDYGEVSPEIVHLNDWNLEEGGCVFSIYRTRANIPFLIRSGIRIRQCSTVYTEVSLLTE